MRRDRKFAISTITTRANLHQRQGSTKLTVLYTLRLLCAHPSLSSHRPAAFVLFFLSFPRLFFRFVLVVSSYLIITASELIPSSHHTPLLACLFASLSCLLFFRCIGTRRLARITINSRIFFCHLTNILYEQRTTTARRTGCR